MKEEERKAVIISLFLAPVMTISYFVCKWYENHKEEVYIANETRRMAIVEKYDYQISDTEVATIFEPGTHILIETLIEEESDVDYTSFLANIPEGYELFDHSFQVKGTMYYHKFVYVNSVPVRAEGVYNYDTNEVVFATPGTPVEEQSLTLK